VAKVKEILSSGVSIHLRDADGATALHWACDRGLFEMAQTLLRAGARVSDADESGMAPLHYAGINNHEKVCQWHDQVMRVLM
jgi:uncharacterized protein